MHKTYKYFADPALEVPAGNLERMLGVSQLPQEYLDFLKESSDKAERQVRQAKRWLENLLGIANQIASGKANGSDVSVFWIRLEGTFEELLPYFSYMPPQEYLDALDKLGPDNDFSRSMRLKGEIASALSKLEQLFTPEEQSFIEYCRHYHSHAFQNGYELEMNQKLQVKTSRKGLDILALKAVFKVVLDKYGNSDAVAAKDFAQRLIVPLTKTCALVDQWLPLS